MSDVPVLSVAVITYNHERWIGECLEGISRQRFSESLEICIGDDGSSDRTSAICEQFATQLADRIPVRLRIRNRGDSDRQRFDSVFMPNVVQTFSECRGKYVAIVEGDDFWVTADKLNLQVQFLESNPAYAMTIHNATMISERSGAEPRPYLDATEHGRYSHECDFSVLDWPRVPFPSCSVVVRRDLLDQLIHSDLRFAPMWDSTLLFLAGTQGLIRWFPQDMGCYRVHDAGCWSGPQAGNRYETLARLFARLIRHLPTTDPAILNWLRTLFDFNYIKMADTSDSSDEFRRRVDTLFEGGTADLHTNPWLVTTAVQCIQEHLDQARRFRESTSFRIGNRMVQWVLSPMRGMSRWYGTSVPGTRSK